MAMGSYFIGATVRIPLQITEYGMALEENADPKIKTIVRPDGTSVYGGPKSMNTLSEADSTYYFDYTPDKIGDYIVIMTYTLEGVEFTTIENFTVGSKTNMNYVPRAESR